MSNIRLRMYNFQETADQIETKRDFKEKFRLRYEAKFEETQREDKNRLSTIDAEPE